jgi:hypothetical protein
MVKNLLFSYADGLHKDESLETSAKMSLDMWLHPLAEDINNKNACVHVLFLHHGQRLFSIKGADAELHVRCKERIEQFRLNATPEMMSYFF